MFVQSTSNIKSYRIIAISVWTLVLGLLLAWNLHQIRDSALNLARVQAQAAFDRDVIYRRWNSQFGGVYVPVTENSLPNPHLADWPERDKETTDGMALTLINPAYMTRQVHELAAEQSGEKGHITSLNPIRPENTADSWETTALEALEQGETVVSSVEEMDGQDYMRLMRPLYVEEACLPCHAQQGYKLGDIRGGISVSAPMTPIWAATRQTVNTFVLGHTIIWLMGVFVIVLASRRLGQSIAALSTANAALETQIARRTQVEGELRQRNEELDAFAHTVAHDLKSSVSIVVGFSEELTGHNQSIPDEDRLHYLSLMTKSGRKMSNVIDSLLLFATMRKEEVVLTPLDMSRIVTEALTRLQPDIEERRAEITLPDSFPTSLGYAPWIEEVWFNYLSNALNYGGEPPIIKISAIQQDDGNVCFQVKDNGMGLAPDEQALLFTHSKNTAQRQNKGHGLGLSIVRRIVHKLNGEVGVESLQGQGSTFWFRLPGAGFNHVGFSQEQKVSN